jgi:quercetin dioxygenase-like cupin family protein
MKKHLWLAGLCLLLATSVQAEESKPAVVVTPILATDETATGQPIQLPQKDAEVVVATYEIAPGAVLPEHKHPYPRYAYVMQGTLEVNNTEAGKIVIYKKGDVVVEAVGQWHKGTNIGTDPVVLVVFDFIEKDQKNVVMKE